MAETETILQLKSDMKTAMRAKDKETLSTVRMLIAALKNKQIDAPDDLTEDDVIAVLSTEAKKRRDASQAYREGDRAELADKEDAELAIITKYLPAQLSDDEVSTMVDEIITQTGAATKADMGKVMGQIMGKIKGRYDGSKVKNIVMSKLG